MRRPSPPVRGNEVLHRCVYVVGITVAVRRLYGVSASHEEGAVYLGRIRLRRQRPGDVPLRPIRATSRRLRHEGLRYASAILALIYHVSGSK